MNPFFLKGYRSPRYYCNRKEETKKINDVIDNHRNLVIYGRRRLGKTVLIQHVYHKRKKGEINLLINLMPTKNLTELIQITATAIIQGIDEQTGLGKKIWSHIKKLNPTVSYDDLSGQPNVSFQYRDEQQKYNMFSQIIELLAHCPEQTTVAFDEFQQILNYPEQNVEGHIRTVMEKYPNIPFIFSGSDQHLMSQMFTQQNRPFYSSSDFLKLDVIEASEYKSFIARHFKRGGKQINEDVMDEILRWSKQVTELVQIICNRLYQLDKSKITISDVKKTLMNIMIERDDLYFMLRRSLTPLQWRVLTAIAKEDRANQLYGSAFLSRHGFTNASSIRRAAESLKKAQFFYHGIDQEESWLELHDVLFSRWLSWRQE